VLGATVGDAAAAETLEGFSVRIARERIEIKRGTVWRRRSARSNFRPPMEDEEAFFRRKLRKLVMEKYLETDFSKRDLSQFSAARFFSRVEASAHLSLSRPEALTRSLFVQPRDTAS
jgi:hypothetical protein